MGNPKWTLWDLEDIGEVIRERLDMDLHAVRRRQRECLQRNLAIRAVRNQPCSG